jgi:hypothetical protein
MTVQRNWLDAERFYPEFSVSAPPAEPNGFPMQIEDANMDEQALHAAAEPLGCFQQLRADARALPRRSYRKEFKAACLQERSQIGAPHDLRFLRRQDEFPLINQFFDISRLTRRLVWPSGSSVDLQLKQRAIHARFRGPWISRSISAVHHSWQVQVQPASSTLLAKA